MVTTSITRAKSDSALGDNNSRRLASQFRWVVAADKSTKRALQLRPRCRRGLWRSAEFFDRNFLAIALCSMLSFSGIGDVIVTTFFVSFLSSNNGNFTVHVYSPNAYYKLPRQDFQLTKELYFIAALSLSGSICCIAEAVYLFNNKFLEIHQVVKIPPAKKMQIVSIFCVVPLIYALIGVWLYSSLPDQLSAMIIMTPTANSQQLQNQKFYARMAVKLVSLCISLQMFKTTLITVLPVPLVLYKMGCVQFESAQLSSSDGTDQSPEDESASDAVIRRESRV